MEMIPVFCSSGNFRGAFVMGSEGQYAAAAWSAAEGAINPLGAVSPVTATEKAAATILTPTVAAAAAPEVIVEADLAAAAKDIWWRLGVEMGQGSATAGPQIAAEKTTVALTQALIDDEIRTVVTVTNKRAYELLRSGAVQLHPSIELGPPPIRLMDGSIVHAESQGVIYLW